MPGQWRLYAVAATQMPQARAGRMVANSTIMQQETWP